MTGFGALDPTFLVDVTILMFLEEGRLGLVHFVTFGSGAGFFGTGVFLTFLGGVGTTLFG